MKILRLNFGVTLIGFLDTHLLILVIALYAIALGAGVGVVGIVVGLYSITNTLTNLIDDLFRRVGFPDHSSPLLP